MDFIELIRTRAAMMGLSHARLAELVHVSPSFVSQVVTRRSKIPLDRVHAWADALGLASEEREQFLLGAKLAHCPPDIVESFWSLADTTRMDQNAGVEAMRRMGEDAMSLLRGLSPADLACLPNDLRTEIQAALTGDVADLRRAAPSLAFRVGGVLFGYRSAGLVERISTAAADLANEGAPIVLESTDAEVVRLRAELAAAHTREQALTAEVTQLKDDLVALGRQLAEGRRVIERLERRERLAVARHGPYGRIESHNMELPVAEEADRLRRTLVEDPISQVASVPRPVAPTPTRNQ